MGEQMRKKELEEKVETLALDILRNRATHINESAETNRRVLRIEQAHGGSWQCEKCHKWFFNDIEKPKAERKKKVTLDIFSQMYCPIKYDPDRIYIHAGYCCASCYKGIAPEWQLIEKPAAKKPAAKGK